MSELSFGEAFLLAIREQASVEVLTQIAKVAREAEATDAERAFYTALLHFQSKCPVIEKTKVVRNDFGSFMYKYAPLDILLPQVQPLLTECELTYTFDQCQDEEILTAFCTITHTAGHSITVRQQARRMKQTRAMSETQVDIGTTTVLLRRAFCNALGILTGEEDDDGNLLQHKEEDAKISAEDADTLLQLMLDTHLPLETVCQKFKVTWIGEMKAKDAQKLITALEAQLKGEGNG